MGRTSGGPRKPSEAFAKGDKARAKWAMAGGSPAWATDGQAANRMHRVEAVRWEVWGGVESRHKGVEVKKGRPPELGD